MLKFINGRLVAVSYVVETVIDDAVWVCTYVQNITVYAYKPGTMCAYFKIYGYHCVLMVY